MKYTHNNHVRDLLTTCGFLGFDNVQECEAAILKDADWWQTWDTTDWGYFERLAVISWRENQIATHAINDISNNILSQYFGVKGIKQ